VADPIVCPSCHRQSGFASLLQLTGLPVHTTRLMHSEAMAKAFPTGNLSLTLCEQCGFIFNSEYNPELQDYLPDSEEAQTCSTVFRDWQSKLIQRLIQQWEISNKTVLEIGCGKGSFLIELCEQGNNHGVGYDPAFRLDPENPLPDSVEVFASHWQPKAGLHAADAIICRHTLEHIGPVHGLLSNIRQQLDNRRDTLLFFEVPDTQRILEETAFWDIYYEHCSYFTKETLGDLFKRTGFDVEACWMDFDEQYLLLIARPSSAEHLLPDSLTAGLLQDAATTFTKDYQRWIRYWHGVLADAQRRAQEVVLWGGGSKAVAFLGQIPGSDAIQRVVDINPRKQGKYLPGGGQRVVAPEDLKRQTPSLVILLNPAYRAEVAAHLELLDVKAELITLPPEH
jgi:SAM-dependent methyltransferase